MDHRQGNGVAPDAEAELEALLAECRRMERWLLGIGVVGVLGLLAIGILGRF